MGLSVVQTGLLLEEGRHARRRRPRASPTCRDDAEEGDQVVIDRAIVDFACVATRTIIEVDGDQHGHDRALSYDAKRTLALEMAGWRVLRFTNAQVMREMDSVLDTILAAMEGRL